MGKEKMKNKIKASESFCSESVDFPEFLGGVLDFDEKKEMEELRHWRRHQPAEATPEQAEKVSKRFDELLEKSGH